MRRFRLQHRCRGRVAVTQGLRAEAAAAAGGVATATVRPEIEMVRRSRVGGTGGEGVAREPDGRWAGKEKHRGERATLTLALRCVVLGVVLAL